MTDSANTNHNAADNDGAAGYYAVDARRVMQVFGMFQMRPSHFVASGQTGAHSVYYDARKIVGGDTSNQWGHHTARAIKSFCHFTQAENGAVLPWRELVEHRDFYDGQEGAGRRTGNLLLTENRLRLKHEAMLATRQQRGLTRAQLAEKAALPVQFIEAMEAGGWETVTKGTARIIIGVLGVAEETFFTQITAEASEADAVGLSANAPTSEPVVAPQASVTTKTRFMRKALLLALIPGLALWMGYQFYLYPVSPQQPMKTEGGIPQPVAAADHDNTLSDIERQHKTTRQVNGLLGCWNWSNGGYIVIDADGTARNGPFTGTWEAVDVTRGHYTIIWPSFVDTLTLSAEGNVLSGNNNYGLPITATRKSGAAINLIGHWLWGNGITVVVRSDSSVVGGPFKGTWRRAGNNWVIEWPLVDTILLSTNGHSLNVKNQFGTATAKLDVSCKGN